MNPAVFTDRDGTLIEDLDYLNDPKLVRVFPGVPESLARLKAGGFKVIIITNQSGISRGLISPEQYESVNAALLARVGRKNIDAVYFCPDSPGSKSTRRKPAPGMVLEAARDHAIDLTKSFFVGDKLSDIQCGKNSGIQSVLVRTGYGHSVSDVTADYVADDFVAATDFILKNSRG